MLLLCCHSLLCMSLVCTKKTAPPTIAFLLLYVTSGFALSSYTPYSLKPAIDLNYCFLKFKEQIIQPFSRSYT